MSLADRHHRQFRRQGIALITGTTGLLLVGAIAGPYIMLAVTVCILAFVLAGRTGWLFSPDLAYDRECDRLDQVWDECERQAARPVLRVVEDSRRPVGELHFLPSASRDLDGAA